MSFFETIPNLYKSIKKLSYKKNKIWPALKAIQNSIKIAVTLSNLSLIGKAVSATATRIIAGLGLICSTIDFVIDRRKFKKVNLQLKDFTENVKNYENLCEFINKTGIEVLAKQFNVDKQKFDKALNLKLKQVKIQNGQINEEKLKEIINLFKKQFEFKRKDFKVALITDSVNVLGGALALSVVAQPILLAILAVVNVSVGAARFTAAKIYQYEFENHMGMVNRGTGKPNTAMDFCKWFFNRYPEPDNHPVS